MDIREQIEWLKREAQRHSQSASDKAFTSRRRSTFRHRAKKLRDAADTMEKLLAIAITLEYDLFNGGVEYRMPLDVCEKLMQQLAALDQTRQGQAEAK